MLCKICRKKINSYMAVTCVCAGRSLSICISCANVHSCDKSTDIQKNKDRLLTILEKVVAEKVQQI